jgi:hypothetical protein
MSITSGFFGATLQMKYSALILTASENDTGRLNFFVTAAHTLLQEFLCFVAQIIFIHQTVGGRAFLSC